MKIRATAKIKITTTPEIIQTIKIYSKGLQFCIETAWKHKIKNNIKLHPFVYRYLRSFGLPSQLAIACIKQSCGMLKKAKSKPIINSTAKLMNTKAFLQMQLRVRLWLKKLTLKREGLCYFSIVTKFY